MWQSERGAIDYKGAARVGLRVIIPVASDAVMVSPRFPLHFWIMHTAEQKDRKNALEYDLIHYIMSWVC